MRVVIVGGGIGKGYRHLDLPKRTHVGNLWMSVAHKFGADVDEFGDATGPIADVFA